MIGDHQSKVVPHQAAILTPTKLWMASVLLINPVGTEEDKFSNMLLWRLCANGSQEEIQDAVVVAVQASRPGYTIASVNLQCIDLRPGCVAFVSMSGATPGEGFTAAVQCLNNDETFRS